MWRFFFNLDTMRINTYNDNREGANEKTLFAKAGWYLKRNGSQHDIYTNGVDSEAVPRHPDINERLAKALIKKWGL